MAGVEASTDDVICPFPGLRLAEITPFFYFQACGWSKGRHLSISRPAIGQDDVTCPFSGCDWPRLRHLSIPRPAIGRDYITCTFPGPCVMTAPYNRLCTLAPHGVFACLPTSQGGHPRGRGVVHAAAARTHSKVHCHDDAPESGRPAAA